MLVRTVTHVSIPFRILLHFLQFPSSCIHVEGVSADGALTARGILVMCVMPHYSDVERFVEVYDDAG
jgi:hypothetical protein